MEEEFERFMRVMTREYDSQLKRTFMGLPERKARVIANLAEIPFRTIKKEGINMTITDDLDLMRLNFTIENDIITDVTFG